MKKLKNKLIKKLGKKGFTLIELLAVIVILALIMVIAIPNVLNSINSSRVSSLHSKAKSIVDAYSNALAADMLLPQGTSNPNAQLKDVESIGVNWACINSYPNFGKWAGLNDIDYKLDGTALKCGDNGTTNCSTSNAPTVPSTTNVKVATCSSIRKDGSGKLYILLVGSKTGKFTVANHVTYAYSEDASGTETSTNWT